MHSAGFLGRKLPEKFYFLQQWSLTTNIDHRSSVFFTLHHVPWYYSRIVKSTDGSSKNCKVNIFSFCFYFSADSVKRKNLGLTIQTELWTRTTARVVTYSQKSCVIFLLSYRYIYFLGIIPPSTVNFNPNVWKID